MTSSQTDDRRIYRHSDFKPRIMKARANDPKEYGYICPKCEKRYGPPQRLGYIDIVRCEKCPPLSFGRNYME